MNPKRDRLERIFSELFLFIIKPNKTACKLALVICAKQSNVCCEKWLDCFLCWISNKQLTFCPCREYYQWKEWCRCGIWTDKPSSIPSRIGEGKCCILLKNILKLWFFPEIILWFGFCWHTQGNVIYYFLNHFSAQKKEYLLPTGKPDKAILI